MEAIVATIALVALILAGLVVLAGGWPRSSPLGGFGTWMGRGDDEDLSLEEERGARNHEDDAGWRWDAADAEAEHSSGRPDGKPGSRR